MYLCNTDISGLADYCSLSYRLQEVALGVCCCHRDTWIPSLGLDTLGLYPKHAVTSSPYLNNSDYRLSILGTFLFNCYFKIQYVQFFQSRSTAYSSCFLCFLFTFLLYTSVFYTTKQIKDIFRSARFRVLNFFYYFSYIILKNRLDIIR